MLGLRVLTANAVRPGRLGNTERCASGCDVRPLQPVCANSQCETIKRRGFWDVTSSLGFKILGVRVLPQNHQTPENPEALKQREAPSGAPVRAVRLAGVRAVAAVAEERGQRLPGARRVHQLVQRAQGLLALRRPPPAAPRLLRQQQACFR